MAGIVSDLITLIIHSEAFAGATQVTRLQAFDAETFLFAACERKLFKRLTSSG